MTFWDDIEKERGLDLEEVEERAKARIGFKSWALLEEISRRQISRETLLKEGDRITRFFHRMTNAHRGRNCFKSISINSRKLDKEADINLNAVE